MYSIRLKLSSWNSMILCHELQNFLIDIYFSTHINWFWKANHRPDSKIRILYLTIYPRKNSIHCYDKKNTVKRIKKIQVPTKTHMHFELQCILHLPSFYSRFELCWHACTRSIVLLHEMLWKRIYRWIL